MKFAGNWIDLKSIINIKRGDPNSENETKHECSPSHAAYKYIWIYEYVETSVYVGMVCDLERRPEEGTSWQWGT